MKAIVLDPVVSRQQLVCEVLTRRRHEVTVVDTVTGLIAARRSGNHQLVFVAADVVRWEGLPLSQQLRLPGEEGSCVILALADEGTGDAHDLLAAGVDDVLAGPLDGEGVGLRTSIAEHRLRRGLRRERWFETLIALGSTVHAVTNARGEVLYTSPSLTKYAGYHPKDMVGKSIFDLSVPGDRESARELFLKMEAVPDSTERCQLRCLNQDGTHSVVEASFHNCLADPLIGGVVVTLTDVTKQREVESALEKSERRYRTLVETAREGIAICDAEETLTFVNPAFAELLGYDRDELEGMNLRELTDETEFERLKAATVERRSGVASRYEIKFFNKRSGTRSFSLSAAPLFDNRGEFAGTLGLVTDITDQKRAAAKLRSSEERYRLIADNVSDVIWTRQLPEPLAVGDVSDEAAAETYATRFVNDLQTTYVSPSVTRMLGYEVSEALSLSVGDVLTESSFAHLRRFIRAAILAGPVSGETRGIPMSLELEYLTKDRRTRWGEIRGNFLWDLRGRAVGILAVTRDVTERKQVETALLESEERLRQLIENMPDFVILIDEQEEVRYVNRGVAGLEPDQLLGRHGFSFLVEECHPACRAVFANALATGDVQFIEAQDVSGLWWSCRLVPLVDQNTPAHVMIICSDVTEEKRANEAVRQEQNLLRQLIELHERDRKVLAFELHDGFAQQLTGAMMSLEVASRLAASTPEKAIVPLDEARRLLGESIEESRRLVSGLRPPVLDEFGIVAAVEHLVSVNYSDERLRIDFVSRGRARRLAVPLENAVFRIVQESLTNIRRHSGSRRAVVELQFGNEQVSAEVRDCGVGFEPKGIREACFGLQGIRERARLLGGHAEIHSVPGEGTSVRVRLPMVERCREDNCWDDDVARVD